MFEYLWSWLPDRCEVVDCERNGIRGDEVHIAGRLICKYCSSRQRNVEFKPVSWWRHRWRWSADESDHHFGPFMYSTSDYRPWTVLLTSWGGGEDSSQPCNLRLSGIWGTLIIALPPIVWPHRRKVYPDWDEETVKRLGRDYYWDIDERRYGIELSSLGQIGKGPWSMPDFLQIKYGRAGGSCMDSSIDQSWSYFLPWAQWRHVRQSFYGGNQQLIGEVFDDEHRPARLGEHSKYDIAREIEARTPKVYFNFKDFDGEQLIAETHIEEREWRFGTGWFKWLSLFRRPLIERSLIINFSGETGKRKGSWKGGTIGSSIEMQKWEPHFTAFYRYCKENDMEIVAPQPQSASEIADVINRTGA